MYYNSNYMFELDSTQKINVIFDHNSVNNEST